MAERVSFHDQISKNTLNSVLLIALVIGIALLLGWVIGMIYDPAISILFVIFALVIALAQILYSYNYGDKVVLKVTGARPANEQNVKEKHLVNVVEGLAIAAGIPKPKVYVIDSKEMNAFATGKDPDHASIAITTGLMEKLNRAELEGVIGHELSHVRNYDIRFATLVAVAVGLIAILSYIFLRSFIFTGGGGSSRDRGNVGVFIVIGIVLAIVAPIVVRFVQLAVSRQREYLADASSAQLTRYPAGLADALEKIKSHNKGNMEVSEAVSHLFFVDPVKSHLDKVFATHPPIERRIEILRSM
jgi:heat shock protein HtpX